MRYWNEEPWGPWRDNLHAALIARELRMLRTRKDVPFEDLLVMHEDERARLTAERGRKNVLGFIEMLKAMAGDKPGQQKKRSKRRPPSGRMKAQRKGTKNG